MNRELSVVATGDSFITMAVPEFGTEIIISGGVGEGVIS